MVDLLDAVTGELALGQDLLEPGVLALQRAQPPDVLRRELAEVLAPSVDRLLAHLPPAERCCLKLSNSRFCSVLRPDASPEVHL